MNDENIYKSEYDKIKAGIDSYFNEILEKSTVNCYQVYLAIIDSNLTHFVPDYTHAPVDIVYPQNEDFLGSRNLAYSDLNNLSNDKYRVYNTSYIGDFIVIIQIEKTIIQNYSDEILFNFLMNGLLNWISRSFQDSSVNVITKSCIEYFQCICCEYGGYAKSNHVFHNTITYINKLSSTLYEGANAKGKLLLCDSKQITDIKLSVRFKDDIQLANRNKARKIFEMSTSDYLLATDGFRIYGLADINEIGNSYIINISGIYKWQFMKYNPVNKTGRLIMDVTDDLISLHRSDLDFSIFHKVYASVFPEIKNLETHWEIIESAKKQKHGTMLLFLEDIENEAIRLSSAGILIEKTKDVKIIEAVTAIDGAVLIDMNGQIHSIGTILDGIVKEENQRDASRGARYNSAINYTATHEKRCIAIVISEDGYINIIANGKKLT